MTDSVHRPIVLITGATGNLGGSLAAALARNYRIVGLDRDAQGAGFAVFEADFTSDASVELAMHKFRDAFGTRIASCIHLVAFFDFSGEDNPLYQSVNVEGTRRLLRALQAFEVEQFVYASTMLVHAPCDPGEHIDEQQPIDPRWAYPVSKAAAEGAIGEARGKIPFVILRLAGVYDAHTTVPTMAQQMARIYERDFKSHFYSGSTLVDQAMLHRDDMLDAFARTVDRRGTLPPDARILIGERDAIGYDALQDELGSLICGADEWTTLRVPKPIAAAGAWAQSKLEPVISDAIDSGRQPFIKPFMVAMADDHYALDIRRARELLGWEPQHRVKDEAAADGGRLEGRPGRLVRSEPRRAADLDQQGRCPGPQPGRDADPPRGAAARRARRQPLGAFCEHRPRDLAHHAAAADQRRGAAAALERDRARRGASPAPALRFPGARSGHAGSAPASARW